MFPGAKHALLMIVASLLAVVSVLGVHPLFVPPAAKAFYPSLHFAMFKQAIGTNFGDEAQGWVNIGLERNDAVPAGHKHPEWHFDSAKDPAAICDLWMAHEPGKKMGPNKLLVDAGTYAVEAFRRDTGDPPGIDRVGAFRREALIAYGQYLHAIQDFYTHSNWIELHVSAGKQPGVAPIQAGCVKEELIKALPNPEKDRLQSGYFDIKSAPADFCGGSWLLTPGLLDTLGFTLRPPDGFAYCHGPPEPAWYVSLGGSVVYPPQLRLAKDLPNQYHGADKLPGGSAICPENPCTHSYHDEAVRLATLATTETLQVLHDRVVAQLKTDLPDRDPECLLQVLLKGSDPACPKRVGLGSFYHGEVAAVDDSALALWENLSGGTIDPETTTALRNVRVSIQLDPANPYDDGAIPVTGGSLSFEINLKEGGTHYDYTATQAHGSIGRVADGYDGWVEFSGTLTANQPNFPPNVYTDYVESFELAVDGTGQPVLCQTLPLPTLDGVRQYQDCLARAVVRLEPGQPPPIA